MTSSTQKANQLLQQDGLNSSYRTQYIANMPLADWRKQEFKGQLKSNADHDRWCRERGDCDE